VLARYYRKTGFVVACQDEATFGLLPNIVRGWARKGSKPVMMQHPQHKYTNVMGARSKRAFVFVFCKKKNQRTFVAFLTKLCRRWGRVCLFIDSAPWHKGELLRKFLSTHRKTFRLIRFPKYSPELNPIESCWKPAREEVGNRLIHSLATLKYHLKSVFENQTLLPKMFKYLSD